MYVSGVTRKVKVFILPSQCNNTCRTRAIVKCYMRVMSFWSIPTSMITGMDLQHQRNLRLMDILGTSVILNKGDNFFDFQFALQHTKFPSERGLL